MWEDPTPVRRESTVKEIISKIKEALLNKELKVGDKLPAEVELAKKLSVSRSVVREAIKVLEAQGVVEIKRGEGTFIAKNFSTVALDPLVFSLILSYKTPEELLELRRMLEVGMLDVVIEKATQDDLQKIEQAVHRFEAHWDERVEDAQLLLQDDLAFHYAFAEATHNPLIVKIAKTIWDMFAPSIKEGLKLKEKKKHPGRRHRAVLEAIKEKDFKKAKKALYRNLRTWKEDGYPVLRR